ncbi:MAG TPA: ABC transporter ATP-binding protein, partial [Chloroflexi bacterium]|nr:ABC transporter ATP-binding protein [Chloroflexota bacterium]
MVAEIQVYPVVEVQGFCKRYRRQVAVDGVDLSIQPGGIYGLIGPDGAGKSSLMKAVAGVLTYEGGAVDVFGVRVDSEAAAEKVKGRIGFMPQGLGLNLYAELSVEENIDFFAQLREVPSGVLAERKRKLLAMTRLGRFRDRPMKNLSGGMKQKLGLVCTLIHEPELVILDEPTTGVDPVSRRDFWAILAELLRERGITALVSTAYMDEAARFHRLSLVYGGRVLAEGEPEQIRQVVPGVLVEVEAEPQIEALQRLKNDFPQVEAVGPVLRVFVPGASPEAAQEQVAKSLSCLTIKAIHARDPELEDAFVALLRQRKLAGESAAKAAVMLLDDPPPRDEIAIEAKGLTRDFGHFRAVDHVGFQVRQGEIFGLLGANGAGKTTVIKMLTGILPPTDGEGHVAGADMRRAGQAIKERIGYMSQAFSLYRDMTVLENIRLYARIYAVPRGQLKSRTDWVIEMAGLHGVEDRLAGNLPMGVRQRLALGCALVHRPRVLFLDEPTSGVDPIGRRRFWDILVQMARVEQVAILVTTHYMSEAEHCDHLALMHAGHIIADATPAQMKQALQQEAGQLLEIATDRPLVALKLLEEAGFEG